jgi:hypothetical protein
MWFSLRILALIASSGYRFDGGLALEARIEFT